MKKSVRYGIVNPLTNAVTLDFGAHKDLMEQHVINYRKKYNADLFGLQARITSTLQIEPVDKPVTETIVGVTLLHGSSLVLTSDNNIAVHDRENDLYTSVGPATLSTLNAIIDAAERLKVHAK